MLNNLLEKTCEKFSDKTALHFFEKKYSYLQLKEMSHALAAGLLRSAVQPGDKVAIFLTNCPEAIVCFMACFKIGVIIVPINQYFNNAQLTHVLNETKPKILISEKKLLPELLKFSNELLNNTRCYGVDDCEDDSLGIKSFHSLLDDISIDFQAVADNQLATISYTSGSTGIPKGVMHTQAQLYEFICNHAKVVKYSEKDHVLICVPIAFAFGFSNQLLPSLYTGATVSLIPAGNYEQVIDTIQNNQVTLMYLGPTTFIQLLNVLKRRSKFSHHLRAIISAGDAMPIALHKHAKYFLDVTIYEGIGMTETWFYALNPPDRKIKLGSSGLPCPGIQIQIVDEYRQALQVGQIGQIAVKGNSVMQGYYAGMKENVSLDIEWFYTGDLGFIDQDGYIFYCGRKEISVIKNGSRIFPHEIEFALYEHPAVYEAGAVCKDNSITAFASFHDADSTVSSKHLFAHLRKHLSMDKMPDKIVILPKLPKGVTGKIDRRALMETAFDYLDIEKKSGNVAVMLASVLRKPA